MAVLRVLEIIVGVMFFHRLIGIVIRARGVEGGTLLALRRRKRQSRADLGHRIDSSEEFWIIFLVLTLFFWFVRASVTNVVD